MQTVDELLKSLAKEVGNKYIYKQWTPTKAQMAALTDESPTVRIIAGNRAGKTATLGRRIAELAHGNLGIRGRETKNEYKVFFVSLTNAMSRQIAYPAVRCQVPESWQTYRESYGEHTIYNPYKDITVQIFYKSIEQGREALQAAGLDFIACDEQFDDIEVYNELRARLVDNRGQMYLGFTALLGAGILTDIEASEHRLSVLDNPKIDPDEVAEFGKGLSEEEYKIRIGGEILDLSGMKYLPRNEIDLMRKKAIKPLKVDTKMLFTEYYFTDTIYEEGVHYAMGVDVATGSNQDKVGVSINAKDYTGGIQQVFYAESSVSDTPNTINYLRELYKIWGAGLDTLVDCTGVGITVTQTLAKEGYGVSLRRKDADMRYISDKVGFKFSDVSREWLLETFRVAIKKHEYEVNADTVLREFYTFQYDIKRRRYDHVSGAHDDGIMASALSYIASTMQQLPTPPKANAPIHLKDMTFNDLMAWEARRQREEEEEYE